MRNSSLIEVSVIAALIISLIGVIGVVFIQTNSASFWWWIALGLFLFVISFGVIYLLMNQFIYKRIKLLFRVINPAEQLSKIDNTFDNNDLIDDVEKQVENYAKNKTAEINELKKMEQYRKEFLGDVSHELKTPIFNTQGYIETLLEGALEDEEINRSYLLKASKNLDRLNDIVEDLVTISKLESEEIVLHYEKFDVVQLTKDIFEEQEMVADLKDVVLKISEKSAASKTVYADKKRISTILNNLINNAIKYGKEEGLVVANFIDLDDQVLVEISDNGEGIEQQFLPRLFDRFYRIDKHRSRFDGGTGLGLAICKHITEAHGQSITVNSEVGKGTTFGFTLAKP